MEVDLGVNDADGQCAPTPNPAQAGYRADQQPGLHYVSQPSAGTWPSTAVLSKYLLSQLNSGANFSGRPKDPALFRPQPCPYSEPGCLPHRASGGRTDGYLGRVCRVMVEWAEGKVILQGREAEDRE